MNSIIGCEVGNYDSKLMTREKKVIELIEKKGGHVEDGSGIVTVTNAISRGSERRTLGAPKSSLVNLLDIEITTSDQEACGRWFVGNLALKEGNQIIKPTREDEKSKNPTTMVMLLTTLAYSLYDPLKPVKKEVVNLGTLLPTEEYFKKGYPSAFANKLIGEHKVKFLDPTFKDGEITLKINDVEIQPEGAAGQTATTFDWNGEAFDHDYENKTFINIDIGSIDTDVSVFEEGSFLAKGFFGLKGGTTDVLRNIASEIKKKYDYSIDTHKLDFHIRTQRPLVIGTVEVKELKELADRHYEEVSWGLSNKLSEELADKGIDKRSLHGINLIGGGPLFFEAGLKKHFENEGMSINIPPNARFKNVEGVLKTYYFKKMLATEVEGEIYE